MNFFVSTAAALVFSAVPAFAQDTAAADTDTDAMDTTMAAADGELDWSRMIRVDDLEDSDIYTANEAHDEGEWMQPDTNYTWGWSQYNAVDSTWNEIGEVADVVLDSSGKLVGVVAEVGGFLDIGDKHVLLRTTDIELVPDGNEYAILTRYNEEDLESMQSVNDGWWD